MLEDIKTFYKYYKLYKKGKDQMDKAKEFVEKYYKEIISVSLIYVSYQIGVRTGVKRGVKFADRMYSVINAAKTAANK